MRKEKIVVVSGGFDPIHSGHIHLINEAKLLGDRLIVLLNSDQWLTNKKGKPLITIKQYNKSIS
jgi:D-beta-D-heptose 7-phosphate kinase/D-beta-D-heptose 1-phosphate adenosyltransferase